MKHNLLIPMMASMFVAMPQFGFAQDKIEEDSVPNTKEVKNRNVMLNASSSDNSPRSINIGLPLYVTTTLFEDGTPEAYAEWPCLPFWSWAGGAAYDRMGLKSLSETALTKGSLIYALDSYSRVGSDKFQGSINYTTNQFGLQKFDNSISGPIANGWQYAVSVYQDFDPNTYDFNTEKYPLQIGIYNIALSKQFKDGKGHMAFIYKHSKFKSLANNEGPFYFNSDGSIDSYEGFNLGHRNYMPTADKFSYINPITGETVTTNRHNLLGTQDNEYKFRLEYNFKPTLHLNFYSKFRNVHTKQAGMNLAGITHADADDGYMLTDGTPYTGNVQNRFMMNYDGFEKSFMNTAELKGNTTHHSWRIGLNIWYEYEGDAMSSGIYAHTVAANPEWLLLPGQTSSDYAKYGAMANPYTVNTGAYYLRSHEMTNALYLSDDWQVTKRLWLSGGVRLEDYNLRAQTAIGDKAHSAGWYYNDGSAQTFIKKNYLNTFGVFDGRYTISHGFGLTGSYQFGRTHAIANNFTNATMPDLNPTVEHIAGLGIFFNRPWIQLVSQVNYVTSKNNKDNQQFTNTATGETVNIPVDYAVKTWGWTTDVVITPFKGFNMHALLTLQSPKYGNYNVTANFSDGTSKNVDFNGNYVTTMSKTLIELDPSYSFSKFRIWASFRYYSKQYINKTNSLFFKAHWESFAGVDYNVNKHLGFSINIVNLFNTKGANGSITSADLLEKQSDMSAYDHYLTSGTYIRPFTLEAAAHINF